MALGDAPLQPVTPETVPSLEAMRKRKFRGNSSFQKKLIANRKAREAQHKQMSGFDKAFFQLAQRWPKSLGGVGRSSITNRLPTDEFNSRKLQTTF